MQTLVSVRDGGVFSKDRAGRSPEFVNVVDMAWTDLGLFRIGFSGKYRRRPSSLYDLWFVLLGRCCRVVKSWREWSPVLGLSGCQSVEQFTYLG